MNSSSITHRFISFLIVECALPTFVFLLVFTLGLRERDTKLKFGELMRNVFKKIL